MPVFRNLLNYELRMNLDSFKDQLIEKLSSDELISLFDCSFADDFLYFLSFFFATVSCQYFFRLILECFCKVIQNLEVFLTHLFLIWVENIFDKQEGVAFN